MSLDPITAGLDLIQTIVAGILPDKTLQEQAQIQLAMESLKTRAAQLAAQAQTNTQEAASSSVFIAGWRPMIGWICGAAFSWQFVILPILLFIGNATGHSIPVPTFDFATLSDVLMGMLGLGAMRSYEKVNGVARTKL